MVVLQQVILLLTNISPLYFGMLQNFILSSDNFIFN